MRFVIFISLAVCFFTSCKKKPEPCFTISQNLNSLNVNEELTFNSACTIDGEEFAWDFGDGTDTTGAIVKHTYTATGTYDVVLTATTQGNSESITRTIEIIP